MEKKIYGARTRLKTLCSNDLDALDVTLGANVRRDSTFTSEKNELTECIAY